MKTFEPILYFFFLAFKKMVATTADVVTRFKDLHITEKEVAKAISTAADAYADDKKGPIDRIDQNSILHFIFNITSNIGSKWIGLIVGLVAGVVTVFTWNRVQAT